MFSVKQKGDFSKLGKYLVKMEKAGDFDLTPYGEKGVAALAAATPKDTGKTADSWSYDIERKRGEVCLVFKNSNIQNGVPIAIILQYGHGTGNGGYVQGRDYINPAARPVFDEILNDAWKEITSA